MRAEPTLSLPDGATGLDIDDDGVALQGSGPLRRRIGARDELRLGLADRAPGGFVERVEIFADRSARPGEIVPVDRRGSVRRALRVGIGLDQAGVDREALAADD